MSRAPWNFMRAAAALLAVIVLIGIAGCERQGAAAPAAPAERPPASVSAVAAISQEVPVYIDAIGKTVATNVVSVVPQVGGKISKALVEDGQYVTKGQLLFEIDPRPFEYAVAAARATLSQNMADAQWAEADFKRTEELMPTKVISQLEYDQKSSQLGVARSKIEVAKAAVQSAELNLEYTKIYSPITGRAGARLVDAGNIVKENEGTLLTIQQLDPIYAEFTVTENDLGTVRKHLVSLGRELGNEGNLGLKVLVDVPGDSDRILSALGRPGTQPSQTPTTRPAGPTEGTLTFLDNTVQTSTGTVKLRATVPNSNRYFWPGQFVNVRLVLTTRKDAVLVPAVAQQIGQTGPYVYVVKPDHTAEMRNIIPGQRQGDLLVIEQGLTSGEKVIVAGQMAVSPGGKVAVTNERSPATAPAPKS